MYLVRSVNGFHINIYICSALTNEDDGGLIHCCIDHYKCRIYMKINDNFFPYSKILGLVLLIRGSENVYKFKPKFGISKKKSSIKNIIY